MTNLFVNDPLLRVSSDDDYKRRLEELERQRAMLEEQKKNLANRQELMNKMGAQRASVWAEIDRLMDDLSENELKSITSDDAYRKSESEIAQLMNKAYLTVIRPIIENSEDGRKLLDAHLRLIKNLRKEVSKKSEKNLELFNEYTEHYSDMTFADFLKMKRSTN